MSLQSKLFAAQSLISYLGFSSKLQQQDCLQRLSIKLKTKMVIQQDVWSAAQGATAANRPLAAASWWASALHL